MLEEGRRRELSVAVSERVGDAVFDALGDSNESWG